MQLVKSLTLLASLASTASGEVAWNIPGQLSQDSQHRLFQISSSEDGSRLARVNRQNGQKRWEISGKPYVGFNSDCVDSHRLFVLIGERVSAFDVENGSLLWSEHVNQEFIDNAGYLTCYPNSNQVYLSYTLDQGAHNKLAAVRKTDGKTLWTFVSEDSINPLGTDAERIYLSRMQDDTTRTRALDQATGREVWQREDVDAYFQWDAQQRLLKQELGFLSRIDPRTGKNLWRVSLGGSYIYSQSLGEAIYAQTDNGITRLDAETGINAWNLAVVNSEEIYTSTQVLHNGQVLVRSSDYAANKTRFQVLDALNGQAVWQRTASGLDAFITEDGSGHLFEQGPSTLQRLGPLGETLWTFTVPAVNDHTARIGSIQSAGDECLVTLFEADGKYPPTSLLALEGTSGAVKWMYKADQPLALISYSEADWIIIGTMLSGRSLALYR